MPLTCLCVPDVPLLKSGEGAGGVALPTLGLSREPFSVPLGKLSDHFVLSRPGVEDWAQYAYAVSFFQRSILFSHVFYLGFMPTCGLCSESEHSQILYPSWVCLALWFFKLNLAVSICNVSDTVHGRRVEFRGESEGVRGNRNWCNFHFFSGPSICMLQQCELS